MFQYTVGRTILKPKTYWQVVCLILLAGMLVLGACGPAATPQTIVQTVVVTKEVQGETVTVVETVEVVREVEVTAAPAAAPAQTQPEPPSSEIDTIQIITFGQGFAWPELFGDDGVSETDRLKEFEQQEAVDIVVEWGDETAVRQKLRGPVLAHGAIV